MSLTDEDRSTIRKTLITSVTLSVIGGLTAGATAMYAYFSSEVGNILNPSPTTDVIITSLVPCDTHEGWSDFKPAGGRFIIGAVSHDNLHLDGSKIEEYTPFSSDLGSDEKPRQIGARQPDRGGEETVTLTVDQMSSHSHVIETFEWGHTVEGNLDASRIDVDDGAPWRGQRGRLGTNSVGGNQPHNNMPPYIALYFCKKK